MEDILAKIDADHGDAVMGLGGHGMAPRDAAPVQPSGWVGREHGRSIPLAVLSVV